MDQNGLGNNRNTIPDIYAGANDKPKKKNAKEIFKLLFSLQNKKRIIIFATHNRYFADMSDCKLSLNNGKINSINAGNN